MLLSHISIIAIVVNGGWGPWNEWIGCSATCGGGQMRRSRRCNDPVPQYNGLDCPGNGTESEQCAQDPCPGEHESFYGSTYSMHIRRKQI